MKCLKPRLSKENVMQYFVVFQNYLHFFIHTHVSYPSMNWNLFLHFGFCDKYLEYTNQNGLSKLAEHYKCQRASMLTDILQISLVCVNDLYISSLQHIGFVERHLLHKKLPVINIAVYPLRVLTKL